mmetsp:Transcript_22822/g.63097  ORF Transcript_22822/g.63097 Transcript_22822/m.63097 type:complete len:124 (-) Transcript_22822:535-906(-)|eukprot:CAMPEP_0202338888 /NCGR_PEP_ID=MMETSP1126-20121109/987_1 /ASSEMBLY_ACC=CAM_ASM_000457 /TAXON_ID=3047 /ORGANISM="Dunaliella tertiolecta, Strain CCMP1320" /LENGTH=123 /DNA_ID=CAMNT_0048929363 /DNA_START=73 /DNA_END=444 /DNA_ORIENTATION=+
MGSNVEELKEALKSSLQNGGQLNAVKAKLRADIFNTLAESEVHPKPPLSNENLLINELIREYMIYNGYRESLSVFLPETGQPQLRPFDRSMMAESLQINEGPNSRQLPLLYSLVKGAQEPKAK